MPSLPQKQTAEKLKGFFQAVQYVTHADSREPAHTIHDMGLIIEERKGACAPDALTALLGADCAHFFTLENSVAVDDFVEALIHANERGRMLIVTCLTDPTPTIIGILKQLSENDTCAIPNVCGKEIFPLSPHPDTRIVFCISSHDMEQTITYPYFINLFGPVLRIP